MKTIKPIIGLINYIAKSIQRLPAGNQEELSQEIEIVKNDFIKKSNIIRDAYAPLLQFNCDFSSNEDVFRLFDRIKENVKYSTSVDFLPDGLHTVDKLDFMEIETPTIMAWQRNEGGKNFVISYNNDSEEKGKKYLNQLVINMLLSLPGKSFRLHFIDLRYSAQASFLTQNLDSSIYDYLVTEADDWYLKQEEMKKKMNESLEKYGGDLVKFNQVKKNVVVPYDLVVILDYQKCSEHFEGIKAIFENGHKGGIYFVLMNNTDDVNENNWHNSLLADSKFYREIQVDQIPEYSRQAFIRVTPMLDNETLAKACVKFINNEATAIEEKPQSIDYDEILNKDFIMIDKELAVPVGSTEDDHQFMFKLDTTVDHAHSFILGQSGSGKSVFLHDIIMAAIAKYSPADLQLYLMDLKIGGVEFNRYRGEKHVKALLVDNSDAQIALEILNEISGRMRERGKMFRSNGVSNIVDYNRQNPSERLPRILIVVDECHVIFPMNTSNGELKLFREISSILIKIAKEGRSQGIHLIFATQTLANTNIPSEIINNISDFFLLKCATSDSERLVDGSSRITSQLTTGKIYYKEADKYTIFKAFYLPNPQSEEIINHINIKTEKYEINQFYFVGTQSFPLDEGLIRNSKIKQNGSIGLLLGRSINTTLEPVEVTLSRGFGENVILFGVNDEEQVSRTTFSALKTAITLAHDMDSPFEIIVINCLSSDQKLHTNELLNQLSKDGFIELLNSKESGSRLQKISQEICSDEISTTPKLIFIFGQEMFRELKSDSLITNIVEDTSNKDDLFGFCGNGFSNEHEPDGQFITYKKALSYIIQNGAAEDVHVVLQVDKPDNLLFEEFLNRKQFFNMFHHLVILKSEERTVMNLDLNDDIHPENLSSDVERLRAIYYNDYSSKNVLFTPFEF